MKIPHLPHLSHGPKADNYSMCKKHCSEHFNSPHLPVSKRLAVPYLQGVVITTTIIINVTVIIAITIVIIYYDSLSHLN